MLILLKLLQRPNVNLKMTNKMAFQKIGKNWEV